VFTPHVDGAERSYTFAGTGRLEPVLQGLIPVPEVAVNKQTKQKTEPVVRQEWWPQRDSTERRVGRKLTSKGSASRRSRGVAFVTRAPNGPSRRDKSWGLALRRDRMGESQERFQLVSHAILEPVQRPLHEVEGISRASSSPRWYRARIGTVWIIHTTFPRSSSSERGLRNWGSCSSSVGGMSGGRLSRPLPERDHLPLARGHHLARPSRGGLGHVHL